MKNDDDSNALVTMLSWLGSIAMVSLIFGASLFYPR